MNTDMPSPPPPPVAPSTSSSSQAMISLILGILSILCCGFLGPIAWYLGNQELQAIAEGRSPVSNEGSAKAGKILGIIGTILLAFGILWILFFGGLGILSSIMESHG